jgi:hypothetical protein
LSAEYAHSIGAARAYTQRVVVGAYYTDGERLAEVTRTYPLGHVQLHDARTGERFGCGIRAFRRDWWRVR